MYARNDGSINDGSIDVTIANDHWTLPATAVSLVAHGLTSNVSAVYVVPAK